MSFLLFLLTECALLLKPISLFHKILNRSSELTPLTFKPTPVNLPPTASMGKVFLEHPGGTRLYSCAKCGTVLTNREYLVSTRFTGSTGRAFLFNKVRDSESVWSIRDCDVVKVLKGGATIKTKQLKSIIIVFKILNLL